MRAMYQQARDSTKAAKKDADAKRVLGTKPSLSLDRYAGTYYNDAWVNDQGFELGPYTDAIETFLTSGTLSGAGAESRPR